MRYLLIFDTETSGLLPKYFNSNEENILNSLKFLPYIVQFSCILFDTKTMKILEKLDSIVNIPEDVDLSEDSIKVHGITKEMTKTGVKIEELLEQFDNLYKKCDMLVAHNLQFDSSILKIEYLRNNKTNLDLTKKKNYCTMQNSVELCNIKSINSLGIYTKFPKLDELHFKLFQEKPTNLHNSYYDIIVCLRCFLKLSNDIDLFKYSKELNSFYQVYIQ
jgi:DNA polymerase-3 subunit epsilon